MDHKTTISDIFSSRKNCFAVPNYQRAYSWEVGSAKDKQVPQFLQDLKEHPASVPHYHLGHFLFEKDQYNGHKFWIVDGQQRLTTIVIFMSCIHRRLLALKAEERELSNLHNDFLINSDGVQKFSTVEYDNNYFINQIIENRPDEVKTKSRRRIKECTAYFDEELASKDISEIMHWKLLVENARITTDIIEDKAEATQVFTFQNDRGKDLTSLEKIKAFFMLQVYLSCNVSDKDPNDAIRFVEREFESIYENLEKITIASEDQLLGYHATAFVSLTGTAVERIKNAFWKTDSDKAQNWIRDFTVRLKQSYEKAVLIQKHRSKDSFLPDVLYLDSASSFPLLLKLLHFENDFSKLEPYFRLVEITLFKLKYTVGNYQSNYLPNTALGFQGDFESLTRELTHYAKFGFKGYWNFDGDFYKYLEGDNHHYYLTRYLLWKHENSLRAEVKESPMLFPEFSNLYGQLKFEHTIDHWAPQNPYGVEYEAEFKDKLLHNIGNMVLSTRSRNASDGNKSPENRITVSTLISRQKLEGVKATWGKEEIKERQREIVAFAKKYWNIENLSL